MSALPSISSAPPPGADLPGGPVKGPLVTPSGSLGRSNSYVSDGGRRAPKWRCCQLRIRVGRLGKRTRDRLIEHFVAGTTAQAASDLMGVHRNSASSFYTRLRKVIAEEMEKASPVCGEIEVDESYFGGARKGKRGRGAAAKSRFSGC